MSNTPYFQLHSPFSGFVVIQKKVPGVGVRTPGFWSLMTSPVMLGYLGNLNNLICEMGVRSPLPGLGRMPTWSCWWHADKLHRTHLSLTCYLANICIAITAYAILPVLGGVRGQSQIWLPGVKNHRKFSESLLIERTVGVRWVLPLQVKLLWGRHCRDNQKGRN